MTVLNATAALRRVLAALLIASAPMAARAQSTTPAPPPVPAPATPVSPATQPAPSAVAPPPAAPDAAGPTGGGSTSTEDRQPPDSSISQTLNLPSHPAIQVSGQASWDEGFKTITGSFAQLNDALTRAKLSGTGHPLAVFTATDDSGFKFTAMIPLDKVPDGAPDLGAGVTLGETPGGKAMRFQHRAAYDDIDSTYEAITAYLDEKGLESKNLFAEEYLDQVKTADDGALEVDIYVFLK